MLKKLSKDILKIIIGICFALLILPNNVVYADYGDFYREHEDFFADFPEPFQDFVKKYDFESNSFDCGTFDFNCHIDGFLISTSIGAVKASYSGSDSAIVTPAQITSNPIFSSYKNALKTSGWLMLQVFLIWNIVKLIAHRFADAEDAGVALNEKLIKIIVLAIFLGLYEQIFTKIMEFQHSAVEAVMDNVVNLEDVVLTIFKNTDMYGFLVALLIACVMLIFQIAFLYRFALFGVLYIMGVVAIPTGMNDEFNYFSLWLRIIISNAVTLFLQALTFTLGVKALFVQNAFNKGTAFTVAMAMWILALSIPSLLGQLGASTGTSRAIGSVVRVVSRRYR